MPKIHSHDDTKIDTEFENIYAKLDLISIETTTPRDPRSGKMWFNPLDGKLKIFKNSQ